MAVLRRIRKRSSNMSVRKRVLLSAFFFCLNPEYIYLNNIHKNILKMLDIVDAV